MALHAKLQLSARLEGPHCGLSFYPSVTDWQAPSFPSLAPYLPFPFPSSFFAVHCCIVQFGTWIRLSLCPYVFDTKATFQSVAVAVSESPATCAHHRLMSAVCLASGKEKKSCFDSADFTTHCQNKTLKREYLPFHIPLIYSKLCNLLSFCFFFKFHSSHLYIYFKKHS